MSTIQLDSFFQMTDENLKSTSSKIEVVTDAVARHLDDGDERREPPAIALRSLIDYLSIKTAESETVRKRAKFQIPKRPKFGTMKKLGCGVCILNISCFLLDASLGANKFTKYQFSKKTFIGRN